MSDNKHKQTTLIIARHGNTFGPADTPTRVGKGTDIPLVEKGVRQAQALGLHLLAQGYKPDLVMTSTLKRTIQTAQLAMQDAGLGAVPILPMALFDEIDYGPDENKTEDQVIARIGEEALQRWDEQALPPQGWKVDVPALKRGWQDFAAELLDKHKEQTILVVTSNGIARFAPVLTGDFDGFCRSNHIKLSTGAYAVMQHDGGAESYWHVQGWNIKPPLV